MTSNEWKSKGKFITVNNNQIFVIDSHDTNLKEVYDTQKSMVVLHGLSYVLFRLL